MSVCWFLFPYLYLIDGCFTFWLSCDGTIQMSDKFLKTYKVLCIAILGLVALGAAVRAMDAGLACPDWPLCFGDVIPDFHPQVYFEFLHRALAGLVGILSVTLNIVLIRSPKVPSALKYVAGFSIVLLFAQVIMGGLTVLLQLHDKVVATHLALGTGFFAVSFWIYLQTKALSTDGANRSLMNEPSSLVPLLQWGSLALVVATYGQLLLGGLVASNYAALVCGNEFPLCHGSFIPTLENLIGIHISHRLGAYGLTLSAISYFIFIFRNCSQSEIRRWAGIYLALLALQIAIGIANVKFLTPPLVTVLHLAVGTMLLGSAVALFHHSKTRPV